MENDLRKLMAKLVQLEEEIGVDRKSPTKIHKGDVFMILKDQVTVSIHKTKEVYCNL